MQTTLPPIYPPCSLAADPDALLRGLIAQALDCLDRIRRNRLAGRDGQRAEDAYCGAVMRICGETWAEYEHVDEALRGYRRVGSVATVARLASEEMAA